MKQKTLFKISDYGSEHGGLLAINKRKSRRPLSFDLPHHFVLSADTTLSGSLVRHRNEIMNAIHSYARKYQVKVYGISVNSNHCHVLLHFDNRFAYNAFVRTVTAELARTFKIKWKLTPYSKMIKLGREFVNVQWYIERNDLEARGLTVYKKR